MPQPLIAFALLLATTVAFAAPPAAKPPTDKPRKQTAIVPVCAVRTPEAPRGGRLELEGQHFGQTPVIRIGGRVVPRIIERTETRISVQIPADSDGGPVTLSAGTQEASCGTLTIIGKN